MNSVIFQPSMLNYSDKFLNLLSSMLEKDLNKNGDTRSVILSFKDSSYSAKDGGMRPVEIMLSHVKDNQWEINYITEFCYVGSDFPELAKSVDFGIEFDEFQTTTSYSKISDDLADIQEFFDLWSNNLVSYAFSEMYDEIEICRD